MHDGSVCGGGVWEEGHSVSVCVCGGRVGWRMCVWMFGRKCGWGW